MNKKSAGILLYRLKNNTPEFFLVHPGGPFWTKKDLGVWTIPKGEFSENEEPLDTARREFKEETGLDIDGKFIELSPVKQKSGKIVYAWAYEGDIDHENIISNTFEMEWPPKSGKIKEFPEIDRGCWFNSDEAKEKIIQAQSAFIEELINKVK